MVSYKDSFGLGAKRQLRNSPLVSSSQTLRGHGTHEQERTSTYLNNSQTKREATNNVKIVVNPVCQAFNTTCGVYQR